MTTPEVETTETSAEDKFFGISTSIEDMKPIKDDPDSTPTIEVKTEEVKTETVPEKKEQGASDDDVESYSKKVQKRIDTLTWQAKEAERQSVESRTMRDEAIRYAQSVNNQNRQQAQIISAGEAHLVDRVKTAATLAVESSRQKYAKAYEEGNTEAILAAQEEMIQAQAGQMSANNYDADYQQRVQQWAATQRQQAATQYQQKQAYIQQQRVQPQQQVTAPPTPTRESNNWAHNNPWFGNMKHRDMTAIAYAKHESLVNDDHVKPDSDEYYQAIDGEMRKIFPNYFVDKEGGGTQANQQKPSTVVAPGSRNNGGKPRTVTLKPTQVALAKKLGLTLEQYAAQLK